MTNRTPAEIVGSNVEDATRPALEKLSADQSDVVDSFLVGFHNRARFIEWCSDAIVATLGELEDGWYRELAMSPAQLSSLIASDQVTRWDSDPADPETRKEFRRALVAEDILPACNEAFRQMRWSAGEYLPDDDSFEEGERSATIDNHDPALRPAIAELSDRQSDCLRDLLDGFRDIDEVMQWTHRLTRASYAEIDGDLSRDLYQERHTRDMLIIEPRDHPQGQFFRESFAAMFVLPAFNRAAMRLRDRAGEAIRDAETPDQSTEPYR